MAKKSKTKQFIELLCITMSLGILCACGNVKHGEAAPEEMEMPSVEQLAEATPEPTPEMPVYESGLGKVRISEVMSKNKTVCADADGDYSDWIEIENLTDEPLDLEGWTLSDGEYSNPWTFPSFTLYEKSRALVFTSKKDRADSELHASFGLSEGDTVYLRDRNGDAVSFCKIDRAENDTSIIWSEEDEGYILSKYPSPGYENSPAGFEMFMDTVEARGPIAINEVSVENHVWFSSKEFGSPDWVEIMNISDNPVELSEFFLSDDSADLQAFRLSGYLNPGEKGIVLCDKDSEHYTGNMPIADFSLNSENEQLYISNASGEIIDCVSLKDIPYDGTYGRLPGRNGFFYLYEQTPGTDNSGGERRMAAAPVLLCSDGIYNNVPAVEVGLKADGTIYYTLDGSKPTEESEKYTGPIRLEETTVLRAISVEEGTITARPLTASFIINENHTLPVASFTADNPKEFDKMYLYGKKDKELEGTLSFFEEGSSFTIGCGAKMNGFSTLAMPKKNIALRFRGCYGDEELNYDLFSGGITNFTNLVLRAGGDQKNTIVRNELFYSLGRDFSNAVITERYKYCVLYLNGRFNGIYAIMEKPNEQHYASEAGVSRESIEMLEASIYPECELYKDVIGYAYTHDMGHDEEFGYVAEHLDIDSIIDWTVIESYSANPDLADGNLRYVRSSENDGKWRLMLYDLDCALTTPAYCGYNVVTFPNQISLLNSRLLENENYRQKLLARSGEAIKGLMSEENFLAEIDRLCAVVDPEVDRDAEVTKMERDEWERHVEELKNDMIIGNKWVETFISNMCHLCHATPEERAMYFGE